jgi:hypothetical protein
MIEKRDEAGARLFYEEEATLRSRTKFALAPDRTWTTPVLQKIEENRKMTVRCGLCKWKFTGRTVTALEKQKAHRAKHV